MRQKKRNKEQNICHGRIYLTVNKFIFILPKFLRKATKLIILSCQVILTAQSQLSRHLWKILTIKSNVITMIPVKKLCQKITNLSKID